MNSVFFGGGGGYFFEFCFTESIFLGVLSVAIESIYLGSSEIPNSADPCL